MSEDKAKDKESSKKGKEEGGGVQLPRIRKASRAPSAAAGSAEDLVDVPQTVSQMDYISPVVPPTKSWIPEGFTLVPINACSGMGVDTYGGFAEESDCCDSVMNLDNSGDLMEEPDLPGQELLTNYRARYQDEDGEPVSTSLADLVSQIWMKGRDTEVMKELYSIYPRPGNVPIHKVDLNPELMGPVGKFGRARDMKMRAIQGNIARSCVPSIRIADALLKGESVSEQSIMDMTMDTITILAGVSESLNQMRRDAIRPSLDKKFQPVCSKTA